MITTKDSSYIIFQMESTTFSYKDSLNFKGNTFNSKEVKQNGDTVFISLSQLDSIEQLKWTLDRDTTWNADSSRSGTLFKVEGNSYHIQDTQDFVLKVRKRIDSVFYERTRYETRDFGEILGFSLIPGGGRFHAGDVSAGIFEGIFQIGPIPFAIYFTSQRQMYFNQEKEAALKGDAAAANTYYDKGEQYSLDAGIAIGISAAAYVLNIYDVFTNVRDYQWGPYVTRNGIGLSFSKQF
jgi:hypothetical protein